MGREKIVDATLEIFVFHVFYAFFEEFFFCKMDFCLHCWFMDFRIFYFLLLEMEMVSYP